MSKSVICDKKGGAYLRAATVILFLAAVLSAVLFFAQSAAVAANVKKRVKITLDSFVIRKSIDAYHMIDDGEDFITLDSQEAFDSYFSEQFSNLSVCKDSEGRTYYSPSSGDYLLTAPELSTTNEGRIRLYADFTLTFPVEFAGEHLFDMKIPMRVSSMLTKVA